VKEQIMPYIKIENIWTDSDDMLQLEVTASNGNQKTTQDFYIYPDDLLDFGQKLQSFPKNKDDSVSIEYGVAPEFYCYFFLKALIWNSTGNAAFEIKVNNRLDIPLKTETHFFLSCEVATINNFGKKLESWSKDSGKPLCFEW
tara:strand:+ start:173 stop:601 length:429 start_codon:yes stop_codon:yes gene_type:complete